jgi:hypothetical protein
MNQLHRSQKAVKEIGELSERRSFLFPGNFANDVNPDTMEHCIKININGKSTYIPTGKVTSISEEAFCLLKDIKIITDKQTYEIGEIFDPIKL